MSRPQNKPQNKPQNAPHRGLFLSLHDEYIEFISSFFSDLEIVICNSGEQLVHIAEGENASNFTFAFASERFIDMQQTELVQVLRAFLPKQPLYYLTDKALFYDREAFIKYGLTDSFLLPIDKECLTETLAKMGDVSNGRSYAPVCLVDIEPNSKLDFEVSIFMPLNNKFITLSREGDEFDKSRLERLKSFQLNTVYVPTKQMDSFYDYSARRLVELRDNSKSGSATDRRVRLRKSVREFVTGLVSATYNTDLAEGKLIKDSVRQIVDRMVILSGPEAWYREIMSRVGQRGDAYSHSGHVSLFATLFSLMLKNSKPGELAVAGLMHDIGLTLLPSNLQEKDIDRMTPEEFADYSRHPELTLEVMRERKLSVPESVLTAITQHHECWSGKGFPNKLHGKNIALEAQIVAIADRFDYFTKVETKISPLDPTQALNRIVAEEISNPDVALEIKTLFTKREAA